MAKHKNTSGEGRKPNRKPAVVIQARLDPELGRAFNEHVDTLRPRTTAQSVIEMLVEQYLAEKGLWPPPGPSPIPSPSDS